MFPSITYEASFISPGDSPQYMLHGLFAHSQVLDIPTLHYQGIGNHATMTSSPQRLTARFGGSAVWKCLYLIDLKPPSSPATNRAAPTTTPQAQRTQPIHPLPPKPPPTNTDTTTIGQDSESPSTRLGKSTKPPEGGPPHPSYDPNFGRPPVFPQQGTGPPKPRPRPPYHDPNAVIIPLPEGATPLGQEQERRYSPLGPPRSGSSTGMPRARKARGDTSSGGGAGTRTTNHCKSINHRQQGDPRSLLSHPPSLPPRYLLPPVPQPPPRRPPRQQPRPLNPSHSRSSNSTLGTPWTWRWQRCLGANISLGTRC